MVPMVKMKMMGRWFPSPCRVQGGAERHSWTAKAARMPANGLLRVNIVEQKT